jgi:hypothetical protein
MNCQEVIETKNSAEGNKTSKLLQWICYHKKTEEEELHKKGTPAHDMDPINIITQHIHN